MATDGGFDVNLLLSSSFIRKSYLFALMRGKQPILLKAAQLSPLSADTFGNVRNRDGFSTLFDEIEFYKLFLGGEDNF